MSTMGVGGAPVVCVGSCKSSGCLAGGRRCSGKGGGQAGICMAVGCPAVMKKGWRADPSAKQNL